MARKASGSWASSTPHGDSIKGEWDDKDAYDKKARELAALFVKNFEQFLVIQDSFDMKKILAAGPKA